MWKDYMKNVLNTTQKASEQWEIFAAQCEDVESFRNAFHLRPTKSKVTVVSTLKHKPMRGASLAKTKLAQFLNELYIKDLHLINGANGDKTIDEENIMLLTHKKFEDRKTPKEKKTEEKYQAQMIKFMPGNNQLKSFLNADKLIFIASEFILHPQSDVSKRERVDIIGYDGHSKLFFFELKTPENITDKPDDQVIRYMKRYGEIKRDETIEVLSNYPINSIKTKDIEFHGYAVYGYSEELDKANSKPFTSFGEPGIIRFVC